MKGSVVDLEAAYKQCPIHPDDYRNSVSALKDPDSNEPTFFYATALPFGASGSVHGFNRLAAALNFLAHSERGLPICNYFDDHTLILPPMRAKSVAPGPHPPLSVSSPMSVLFVAPDRKGYREQHVGVASIVGAADAVGR